MAQGRSNLIFLKTIFFYSSLCGEGGSEVCVFGVGWGKILCQSMISDKKMRNY